MITLRSEQRTTVDKAKVILAQKNIVYLAAEVRTGKNFMSFTIAKEIGWKRVAFITKKKALIGVVSDYENFGNGFTTFVPTNFEQVAKLLQLHHIFDGFIIDEAHATGQHPKPSQRTKALKELIKDKPVILMSGSPTPETLSQIYHQFWITQYGPFQQYKNFYKWAHEYVNIKQRRINGWPVNDYSHAKEEKINLEIGPYMVRLSQEEAGFTSFVDEEILWVKIDQRLYQLMDKLKKDKLYKMKNGDTILADTPVKMQSLFHQISSGTVNITKIEKEKEVKNKYILDESKAWFVRSKFAGQKIAIFYCFIAEGDLLRKVFPDHTDNPEEFNNHEHLTFICQVVSGREGTNLSTADALVMYNIAFSATSYWQARARMQTKDRVKASKLFWVFSEHGIEKLVYKAVSNKKNYTLQFFNRDFDMRQSFKSFKSTSGASVVIYGKNQKHAEAKAELFKAIDSNTSNVLDAIDKVLAKYDGEQTSEENHQES